MTDHTAIDAAIRRLQMALDSLEAAAERKLETTARTAALAEQVHALETDRARLAADLDNAAARSKTLENANREVAERLDIAMDTIRAVIAAQES